MEVYLADENLWMWKNVDWNLKAEKISLIWFDRNQVEDNSLGLVQNYVSNEYNIYIHDYTSRVLFDRESRGNLIHGMYSEFKIQNKSRKSWLNDQSWTDEKIHKRMHHKRRKL